MHCSKTGTRRKRNANPKHPPCRYPANHRTGTSMDEVLVMDINFPAGHRYAVIDGTGYTTHKTKEDTVAASMDNERLHEIIDSNGEKYLVVHYDTGTRLTNYRENHSLTNLGGNFPPRSPNPEKTTMFHIEEATRDAQALVLAAEKLCVTLYKIPIDHEQDWAWSRPRTCCPVYKASRGLLRRQ